MVKEVEVDKCKNSKEAKGSQDGVDASELPRHALTLAMSAWMHSILYHGVEFFASKDFIIVHDDLFLVVMAIISRFVTCGCCN